MPKAGCNQGRPEVEDEPTAGCNLDRLAHRRPTKDHLEARSDAKGAVVAASPTAASIPDRPAHLAIQAPHQVGNTLDRLARNRQSA